MENEVFKAIGMIVTILFFYSIPLCWTKEGPDFQKAWEFTGIVLFFLTATTIIPIITLFPIVWLIFTVIDWMR